MKSRKFLVIAAICLLSVSPIFMGFTSCDEETVNTTATKEQEATEQNQSILLQNQPPPKLTWSLERDNVIRREKLQNDKSIMFYMYVFVPGVPTPIAYYQVNKVSSVDSQVTNTQQIVQRSNGGNCIALATLPSPAEDGSYNTNGNGVFGFTPEEVYVEHNMLYLVTTVPVAKFNTTAIKIGVIDTDEAKQLLENSKKAMK